MRWFLGAAAVVFVIDQVSKLVVVHWMGLKDVLAIDVVPPLLNFRMGWNRGVNFGLFANDGDAARWALIALSVAVSAFLFWWARSRLERPLHLVLAGAIMGGALANALDRVLYGAVADFLNMSCCGIDNPFAFNLADVGIFAGAIGLFLFGGGETATKKNG